ncbi:MAG: hypothetical protein ABI876_00875 [Bacteroidota bacterium]
MSYIIPHNASPRPRSIVRLGDGWQGSAQWFFQVHLVCAAMEWLSKNVVEDPTRPNRGPLVDQIHLRYRGWDAATLEREWAKTKDGVGLAWCAEFVWVVVDDVCRKVGLSNCLPGWSAALGRAKDTLVQSRSKLPTVSAAQLASGAGVTVKRTSGNIVLGKDGWPDVGQVFYRTSQAQRQGSDSTGHMGIVVSVRKSDGYFETIEGNQGTTNRVGLYKYTKADLATYSFEFIHIAECAAVKDTPDGIVKPSDDCFALATGIKRVFGALACPPGWTKNEQTQNCECTAPKKIDATGNCVTCDPPAVWDATKKICVGPAPAAQNVQPTDCSMSSVIGKSFASLPAAEKQKACTQITFKDIDVGLLLHYSALKTRDSSNRFYIAADILGATYGIGGDRDAFFGLRNGSAVNRKNAIRDGRDQHTGMGIFKMRSGRLVYFCAEKNVQWNNLWYNNLIGAGYGEGKEPWRIHIERVQGSGFGEMMAQVFAGDLPLNGPNAGLPRLAWIAQSGRPVVVKGDTGGGVVKNLFDSEIPFRTLFDILDAIEKQDKAGESRDLTPVVISYNMDPIPWTKDVQQVIQVASVVVAVALPVAGTFASASVLTTIQQVQDNLSKLLRVVSGLQNGDAVTLALDLGSAFLPATYQQYVAPAKGAYRAVIGKNPTEAFKALQLLSRTDLGVQVTAWGQQLVDNVGIDLGSIAKVASKPFDYVRQQIATYQVGHMIGTVADLTAKDVDFAKTLFKVSNKSISEVSYLSTFVTSLAGGRHPATLPNLGGLSRMVAMSGEFASMIEGKVEGARSDTFAVLSLLGAGFASPCAVFRDLAYQSFRQQAEKLRGSGVKTLSTPTLLGAEDSECFAYRIRGDVPGLEVLYGDPAGSTGTKITGGSTVTMNTNDWNPPQNGLPNIGLPNIGLPNIGLPNIGLPNIGLPNIGLPKFDLPKFDLPNIDLPNIDLPKFDLPKFDLPKFDPPQINPPYVDSPVITPPVITPPIIDPPQVIPPRADPPIVHFENDWNPVVQQPPIIQQPQCPPGYILSGNQCLPPPPVIKQQECPPGYILSGNQCLPPPPVIKQQQCPDGYSLVGNECVPPPPVIRQPPPPPPNDWNPPQPPAQPPQQPQQPVWPFWPPMLFPPYGTPPYGGPPYGGPPYGAPPSGGCGCGCCD